VSHAANDEAARRAAERQGQVRERRDGRQ
jgi:hypothetical protein